MDDRPEIPLTNTLSLALQTSLDAYMESRRNRISRQWEKLMSFKNCQRVQFRHFFRDLICNPLNTLWAIPYLSIRKVLEACDKLGIEIPEAVTAKIPKAIKTDFQKEMERLIQMDLFGLSNGRGYLSALAVEIENNDALKALMTEAERKKLVTESEADIHRVIADFCTTHNGFTDLAASGGVLLIARRFFRDGSLDIFGISKRLAGRWAHDDAVSHFVLGKEVGSVFYRFAPAPGPTHGQIFMATACSLVLLAFFSTAVNAYSYPIQNTLGFQKKQLEKLIQGVEDKLLLRFAKCARGYRGDMKPPVSVERGERASERV